MSRDSGKWKIKLPRSAANVRGSRTDWTTVARRLFPKTRSPAVRFGLGALAIFATILWLDLFVAKLTRGANLPGDLRRALGLCEFFGHGVGIAVVAWGIWQLAPLRRRCLPRLLAFALLPGLLVNLLKLVVCRLRPIQFGDQLPISIWETWVGAGTSVFAIRGDFGTYAVTSFPSGHAATAMGLALGLAWLFPSGRNVFVTLGLLASIQRVASHAHWLSDVVAGGVFAYVIAKSLLTNNRISRWFDRWERRESAESLDLPDQLAA